MGAREDFELAVDRGDFEGAAALWMSQSLEASPRLDAFETQMRSSLAERSVTIGRTLVMPSGEYEYLAENGQNGARLAFVPNAGSLDEIEYIADVRGLNDHLDRAKVPQDERAATVSFFAMSERAAVQSRVAVPDVPGVGTNLSAGDRAAVGGPQPALRELLLAHGDTDAAIEAAQKLVGDRLGSDRVHVGTLLDFGPAPYLHDEENATNYFVKFVDPRGKESTVWGKELATAIQAAELRAGSEFVLAFQGAKEVNVPVKVRDAAGKPTGEERMEPALRNEWRATSVARLRVEASAQVSMEAEAAQMAFAPSSATPVPQPSDWVEIAPPGDNDSSEIHSAYNIVELSKRTIMQLPPGGLTGEMARVIVRGDVADFQQIADPELRVKALGAMVAMATVQELYKAELSVLSPELSDEVSTATEVQRAQGPHKSQSDIDPTDDLAHRMAGANWFYFTSDDASKREAGAAQIAQIKDDLKALSLTNPKAASELWIAGAPAEYVLNTDNFLLPVQEAAKVQLLSPAGQALRDKMAQTEMAWMYSEDPAVRLNGRDASDQLWEELEVFGKSKPEEGFHIWKEFAQSTYPNYMPKFLKRVEVEAEPINAIQGVPSLKSRDGESEGNEDAIQEVKRPKMEASEERRASDDAFLRAPRPDGGDIENGGSAAVAGKPSPKTLLNGRFILRDNGEYFRVSDGVESKRVALVDEDSKIRFVDKQMDTFQAAIELAKHKDWEAILVTGSDKFRAEAWHHARVAGLEVIGYEPTEKDLATLKVAQENQGKAKVGAVSLAERTAVAESADTKSLEAAKKFAIAAGFGAVPATLESGRHVGKILHETEKHFAQDTGRKIATIHSKSNFDGGELKGAMDKGGSLKIQYEKGRARIESGKDKSQSRGGR